MEQTPNSNAAANISKAVDAKAAGTPPAKTETAVIKNQENGGIEVKDVNAGKEKYVVDGKEYFLTPEQAKAYIQKGIAFEPKVSHLGRLQQETAAFLDTLSKDPAKVLYNSKFGSPKEVLARILQSTKVSDEIKDTVGQWFYNNVVIPEGMTPEQREAAEYKRKAEEYDSYKKAQEDEHLSRENEAKVQNALAEIKAKISEAMSEAGVPIESPIAPQLAKRVAQIMQLGFVNGKVVTPKEAMVKAKAEIMAYQQAYFDGLDEDKLVEQIGKGNAEKVRKYYLKQVKDGDKTAKKDSTPAAKRDQRKVISPDDFRDYLSELKKKG